METILEERQKRREKSEDENTQARHEKGEQNLICKLGSC